MGSRTQLHAKPLTTATLACVLAVLGCSSSPPARDSGVASAEASDGGLAWNAPTSDTPQGGGIGFGSQTGGGGGSSHEGSSGLPTGDTARGGAGGLLSGVSGTRDGGGGIQSAGGNGGAGGLPGTLGLGGQGAAGTAVRDAAGESGTKAIGGGGSAGFGGANTVSSAGCPTDGTRCPVMCVGDSITWGVTDIGFGHGGYRVPLFHLANQHSRLLTFVGSLNDATEKDVTAPTAVDNVPFPGNHEGHRGWVIQQITDIIVASIQANRPRMILLMIGTNDMASDFDPPTAPERLGMLLDKISSTDPSLTVVVAQLPPSQDDGLNPKIQAYNTAMPALVKARADAGQHVSLVDMYSAFTDDVAYQTELLQNTLHPSDGGYAKMADVWYAGIGDMLPRQP